LRNAVSRCIPHPAPGRSPPPASSSCTLGRRGPHHRPRAQGCHSQAWHLPGSASPRLNAAAPELGTVPIGHRGPHHRPRASRHCPQARDLPSSVPPRFSAAQARLSTSRTWQGLIGLSGTGESEKSCGYGGVGQSPHFGRGVGRSAGGVNSGFSPIYRCYWSWPYTYAGVTVLLLLVCWSSLADFCLYLH
jgi:hypothetical protein